MAQEGSIGSDANLVVVVDGSKAIRDVKSIENAVKSMADKSSASLNKMSSSFNNMRKMLNNFPTGAVIGGITAAFALATAVAKSFADQMIEVNRIYTGFIATMNTVKGSTTAAEKEYAFLLETSNKLGVEVKNAIPQYAKLSAALKNVDKDGELTRHLFTAISEAAVVLHSRGRDVTLIFEAFQQMASKGKLSLEELQRQLGNTLPGAVGLAARAMKMSEADLRKGIEKGTIDVYEFLAKVANQLKIEYGDSVAYAASQFTARINVMRNAIFEFYKDVGNNGAMKGFVELLNSAIKLMSNSDVSSGLGESIGDLFSKLSDSLDQISPANIADAFSGISLLVDTFEAMITRLTSSIGELYPNSRAPLTEFIGFFAQWAGGITDVLMVLVNTITIAVAEIVINFYRLNEHLLKLKALKDTGSIGFRSLLGLGESDSVKRDAAELSATLDAISDMEASKNKAVGVLENRFDDTVGIFTGKNSMAAAVANLRYDYRSSMEAKDAKKGSALLDSMTGKTAISLGAAPRPFSPLKPKPVSLKRDTNLMDPLSPEALQSMVTNLGTSPPNGDDKGKSGKSREENRYLSQRGSLLRDLNKLQTQYNNLAAGRAESEGENASKIRSLIEEDERYAKLTEAQKQDLKTLAQQLDDAAKAYEQLSDTLAYLNETNRDSLDVERQLAQLRATGYTSKYNQRDNLEAEFLQGGKYFGFDEKLKEKLRASADKRDENDRLLEMEKFTQEIRRSNEELLFQQNLYGKTKEEIQLINALREIEIWYQKESVGLTGEALENLKKQAAVLKGEVVTAYEKVNENQQDVVAGLKDGLSRAIDDIGTPFERFSNFALDSINKIGDAFGEWITTGKMDFKSLAAMMLAELAKIIFQLYVMKPLLDYMKTSMGGTGIGGGTGMGGIGGGIAGAIGGVIGGLFGFANGGVFDNSVNKFARGASFNRNGDVYGHKYFQMGEMGEAGPEAIMPLARDSNGVLGVRMAGGSSSDSDNIQIVVNVASDGNVTATSSGNDAQDMEQLGKLIGYKVRQVIQDEKRVGGLLA